MPATTTLTVRLSAETKAKLDRLAKITERSKSFLAAKALDEHVTRELEICEGILEGIAEADAGRTVPHEDVMAEMQAIIDAASAEQRKRA
ncbi:CopG family ribbon-helix-helix protein [Pelagibacterium luteolum]|uniref:Predicted transcriptional regulator n=1 Tax=Pelagibacterium luteolum TaxID=440168 RepID=A0A1G7TNC4_9HYPH|nr:ribbon-helix-helix protein, CopG family [Pelagibacterium luteolum]SDG36827.1 Predicted transcriptional regulator [Pelagibacterium luteolum]